MKRGSQGRYKHVREVVEEVDVEGDGRSGGPEGVQIRAAGRVARRSYSWATRKQRSDLVLQSS
jgi:hypothetical protein